MNYKIRIKILLTTIATLSFSYLGFAQEKIDVANNTANKLADQEAKPTFDYNQYIALNFKYPQEAFAGKIEGKVLVKFVVQADGTITDTKVSRGIELAHGIPEEAFRVVSNMPKWTPAYADGKPVKSDVTVPIKLKLADEAKEEIVADTVETEARPGYEWQSYLDQNLHYPRDAMLKGTSGKLLLKFTVTEYGEIENVKIVKGENIKDGLPEEALRVIQFMPKWIPGTIAGKAVRSYRTIPINFRIETESDFKERAAPPKIPSSRNLDTSIVQPIVEVMAEPNFDLEKYLNKNLRYPREAYEMKPQGTVYVKFIVTIQGKIEDLSIVRGNELGYGLPEEAIRVITNMPEWFPAKIGRKSVKSYYTIPIHFRLD